MQPYDTHFYNQQRQWSFSSAEVLVPLIMDLVNPRSVVDVGCGLATWLAVFQKHGVSDVTGLDGDYVDRSQLFVAQDLFRPTNLAKPFQLDRCFDLAVSLEVAEHLPAESAADFVGSLVGLSSCVVFSAGLPFQGGTNHVNEQWPEYWAGHFAKHGFEVIDCFRKHLWSQTKVQPCYAQNTLLFVHHERLKSLNKLQMLAGRQNYYQLSVVHPEIYLNLVDPSRQSFRASAKSTMAIGWRAAKRRTRTLLGRTQ